MASDVEDTAIVQNKASIGKILIAKVVKFETSEYKTSVAIYSVKISPEL